MTTTSGPRAGLADHDGYRAGSAPDHAADAAAPPLRRNRPYLLLMTGLTADSVGGSVTMFAVPLVALSLTGSATAAGVIAAVGNLGALLATLPAGVVADRTDRRRLIVASASIGALLWTAVVVAGVLGALRPWHLAVALLGAAVARAFIDPAISGAFRSVVPAPQLPTAYAAAQGRDAAAEMLGRPLGGVLYALSAVVPFAGAALGQAAAAIGAWCVRVPLNGDVTEARRSGPVAALREGLAYVWSVPLFRACLGLFVVVNIAIGGILIGINLELARTGTPPVLIGVVSAVAAAAMLAGSFLAPVLVRRLRLGACTVLGLAVLVAGLAAMAVVQSYPAYVVGLGFGVLLVPTVNAAMAGYTAAVTPPQLQGRLSSVLGLSGLAAGPVAPLVGGALLDAGGIGTVLWSLVGLMAVTVVALCLVRSLWRVGTPDTWADDALPVPTA
jgi:MFS family permease